MKFKGLNAPVNEPNEKEKTSQKHSKHRLFMKKDKKKFFGRRMRMIEDGR
jgi:hypothetical protein